MFRLMNDVILHMFTFHHWEVGNQSMDLLEIFVLWVLNAASSNTRCRQDELDELCLVSSLGGESVDGIGLPQAVLLG